MNRPIVFFDLETTGLSVTEDRIVEIAICKQWPDGKQEIKTRRFNPGCPIPKEASDVHGITDDMVKELPGFGKFANGIHEFIKDCDLAGYNSNSFDVPFLYNELFRYGIKLDYLHVNLIDVGNLAKILNPRTLSAMYKQYSGKDLEDAHSAEADIMATVELFSLIREKHKEVDVLVPIEDVALMSNHNRPILDLSGKFTTDKDGIIILNFGQHRGTPAKDHVDFLKWMVGPKATFAPDTIEIAVAIINMDHGS